MWCDRLMLCFLPAARNIEEPGMRDLTFSGVSAVAPAGTVGGVINVEKAVKWWKKVGKRLQKIVINLDEILINYAGGRMHLTCAFTSTGEQMGKLQLYIRNGLQTPEG